MNTIKNSYSLSRVAVCLNGGSNPSVTLAFSTFEVNELAYRTSPVRHELVARHVSRVDDVKTIPVDRPMLDRVRRSMSRLSNVVRNNADEFIERDETDSKWFFQPSQDGWLAMFNGKPRDVRAFHHWLCEILA